MLQISQLIALTMLQIYKGEFWQNNNNIYRFPPFTGLPWPIPEKQQEMQSYAGEFRQQQEENARSIEELSSMRLGWFTLQFWSLPVNDRVDFDIRKCTSGAAWRLDKKHVYLPLDGTDLIVSKRAGYWKPFLTKWGLISWISM